MRPPEDSGGPWGYAEMLEALGDSGHEYHEQALEILGEGYDPHSLPDISLINAEFAELAKMSPSRSRKRK